MRRKKTKREREIALQKKRHKHEMQKRRREDEAGYYFVYGGELVVKPHILKMVRKPKEKKK